LIALPDNALMRRGFSFFQDHFAAEPVGAVLAGVLVGLLARGRN
jgi:hypothetical protein